MLALIPIILVLILSLKTKNLYFALIVGIISALLIFTGFNPVNTMTEMINVFASNANENMDLLLFVAFLGIFVHLVNKSGVSHYFASKAILKLKTRRQTVLTAMALGILCFIDDYFNCLTVNTIMGPIFDKQGMSREKLAYVVDATAAPVCELIPISSWAGLVGACLPAMSNINGFGVYIKTIPINFYPILTLLFITSIALMNFDFGRMKKLEDKARMKQVTIISEDKENYNPHARLKDLFLPIIFMSVTAVFMMLYTGGFFSGNTLTEAFVNCSAMTSCALASIVTVIFMGLLYIPRKVMSFRDFIDEALKGFEGISTAILILLLAWVFATVCGEEYLNFTGFAANIINSMNVPMVILPAVLFLATFIMTICVGVSWTAIALMIPLAVVLFNDTATPLMVLTTAAIISGGAAGDHIGPTSDTTTLSASIAKADLLEHIISQFQYGIIVVIISFLGYLIAGISGLYWLGLLFGIILVPLILFIIKHIQLRRS